MDRSKVVRVTMVVGLVSLVAGAARAQDGGWMPMEPDAWVPMGPPDAGMPMGPPDAGMPMGPPDAGGMPSWCGDGFCDDVAGEGCASCPDDCGWCATCGDGMCDPFWGEDCWSCDFDCGPCGGEPDPTSVEHPIPPRAGAPKPWEDVGLFDDRGDWAVSPNGNVLHRFLLFAWGPPGVGNPIAVGLVHNSVDGDVQRGAGYGVRLAVAGSLEVAPDGVVTVVEPDGTPRVFTPGAGGYAAEPLDRGALTFSGAQFVLDEGGGQRRIFADATGLGFVERWRKDRLDDTVTFTYDAENALVSASDSAGRTATFTRAGGFYTAFVDPQGRTYTPVYVDGELRELRGPAAGGEVPAIHLGYDWWTGRHVITSRTTWSGGGWGSPVLTFSYFDDATLQSVTFPDGVTNRLDSFDGRVVLTDSLGRSTSLVFWDGAVAEAVFPNGETIYLARDAARRPIQMIDGEGSVTTYAYGPRHDVTSFIDELGRQTTYTWDARHNLLTATGGDGRYEQWTYNALDQILTHRDVIGEVTTNEYDATGNLLRARDFAGVIRYQATYGALGKPLTVTGADGRTATLAYNAQGFWTSVTKDGLSVSRVVDAHGRVASVTDPYGTTSYVYDGLGRITETELPDGGRVVQELDLDGRVTRTVDTTGPVAQQVDLSYTPTSSVATRAVNGRPLQTAPPLLGWTPWPEPASCTPSCGNRCGTDVSDSCGGTIDCSCAGGQTCSAEGYCVTP